VSALTAAKFGTTQNMRLVCFPPELSVSWLAVTWSGVGVSTVIWGSGWVLSDRDVESPVASRLPGLLLRRRAALIVWTCCLGPDERRKQKKR